ncbi:MAG: hypothetical protein ACR2N3_12770 [Pyrinomonadaceae bacterium]
MAEKTKTKPKTSATGSTSDCKDYVLVRNALDSVQYTSINYFLDGKTTAEKKRRAAKIKTLMLAVIREIQAADRDSNPDCDGCMCNGFCLPYTHCP